MRYRIETWENTREVHYSESLSRAQVEANLSRSGNEVRLAVCQDLDKRHTDTYTDFANRIFIVTALDK